MPKRVLPATVFVCLSNIKNGYEIFDARSFGNISIPYKRLEIGWTWLHPKHQGNGLNKACKFLLLQFAFEQLQFNRVELKTDNLNNQSQNAMRKIGATEEGIFRMHSNH